MAIATNPGIVDDAVQMVSARIVLTNAQAGDILIVGNLPAGIDDDRHHGARPDHRDPDGSGFPCRLPDGDPGGDVHQHLATTRAGNRIIQVTVNDGFMNSNVATTTVNVVPVNDAPSGEQRQRVHELSRPAPFMIPEWALLANDTDGEGAALDITSVSAAQRPHGCR